MVVPTAPKICPHCGAGNPQRAATCHCGAHFDLDPLETRAVIVRRRRRGVIQTVGALALLVGEIAVFLASGWISVWLLGAAALLFSNGIRVLLGGVYDLREHDAKPRLPRAIVRR